MKIDWIIVVLAILLMFTTAALVFVLVTTGSDAAKGTGLGALNTAIVGAIVWRTKSVNGKGG